MNDLLQLTQINKEYSSVKAVDNVSFSVAGGSIFGLLGPNGAGKTSLIRIITGITHADSGQVLLNGLDTSVLKNPSIGYMPEERGLYKKMKVGEQLVYLCRLKGFTKKDAEAAVVYWMRKFEIESWWNKKIEELSKGMSQKIQFIATVVHKPSLIILDEPFSGLDPINSNLIKDEIIRLKNEGSSILFSTHRMEQVEEMCEEIVLMNKGKVVLNGHVNDIRNRFKENIYEIMTYEEIPESIYTSLKINNNKAKSIIIQLAENQKLNDILKYLIDQNIQIKSLRELLPTFNDIFIRTVNEVNYE
ncbi:MAG: ATP-binding cassette domain-containing protein [Saprospiraceae bacterium]|jgi:ABC-2 type transport system ATP-binding protein|nr:ATP-binding cassette domain-containing protein [Candidatus Defluviibacterium haderslevense]MBK7243087.1 ATP-binding cassette domain-containing protein [Candidatus Defluviibacterium haderslevense]MCC7025341.1 ATP-binding cassette domain-containing protein [Saprospiraceae bacterium]MCI1266707.1 ATP-binding cassette domain-containing protein [Saprospiraceae bacterium]HRI32261.1 ATP-binding cassette domain-containing protein [Saprospiraceae bacterium]